MTGGFRVHSRVLMVAEVVAKVVNLIKTEVEEMVGSGPIMEVIVILLILVIIYKASYCRMTRLCIHLRTTPILSRLV
jgi:hypothetical protein